MLKPRSLACVPQELKKFETIVNRQELAALHHDVDGLRGELLRLEDEWRCAQVGWHRRFVSDGQRVETHVGSGALVDCWPGMCGLPCLGAELGS